MVDYAIWIVGSLRKQCHFPTRPPETNLATSSDIKASVRQPHKTQQLEQATSTSIYRVPQLTTDIETRQVNNITVDHS